MGPLQKYFDNRDEKRFLVGWRSELNDFEKDVLIPGFKGRIDNIIKILERMKGRCVMERSNPILPHLFLGIHSGLGIPMNLAQATAQASSYIDTFEKIIEQDFLVDARSLKNRLDGKLILNEFVKILVDIKNYCSGVLGVENETFAYLLGFSGVILDSNGNFVKTVDPVESKVIWYPFKSNYRELSSVAKFTIESIDEWESTQQKTKERYLNFKGHMAQIRGFRWSVAAAIIFSILTSWVFYVSTDWLKLSKYEKELMLSDEKVRQLERNLGLDRSSLTNCQKKLDVCESPSPETQKAQ